MTKSYFISDSILKGFLHILRFSELFWWWMVSNFFRFYTLVLDVVKRFWFFKSLDNSGCRPRFVNAELDPGGRGKELVGKGLTTHKNQIRIQFYKWNPFKKSSPKNWNRLQIYMKNPLEIYRTSKKNLREFPLNEFPVKFTGDFFYKYFTFRLILKKSYQEGVFYFFYLDPQLVQNFKPTRNLSGQFYIYIYKYI